MSCKAEAMLSWVSCWPLCKASDRDSATGSPKPRRNSIVSSDDDAELFAKTAGVSLVCVASTA